LRLVRPDPALFTAGDEALAAALGVTVVPGWVTFTGALASARAEQWGTRLFVADGELVGWGGFKGPPDDGAVEIGYEIAAARQGRGLATQAASLMVDEAFAGGASRVLAHTLPEQNASNRVLAKLGFRWDGDAVERGRTVWRFVRERD
jgi:[ribosomal protein S5]-alanine N-acetyltransferase